MRPLRRCTPGGARESGRSAASRQSAARAPRARAAAPPAPPRRRAVSAHGMLWSGLCSRGRPRRAGRARAHRCMAHVAARMLFCIAGLPGGARRGRCPALALAGAGSRPLPPTCSLLLAQRLYSKESRFGIHQQRRPVRVLGRQACARQPHRRCRAGPHPDVALDAGVAHDRIGGGVDVQLREARQRGRRRDHGLDRASAARRGAPTPACSGGRASRWPGLCRRAVELGVGRHVGCVLERRRNSQSCRSGLSQRTPVPAALRTLKECDKRGVC